MLIKWKNKYNVGIKEIDDQHQRFIKIINKFYDAIVIGKSQEELSGLFQTLTDYAEEHFSMEEKYFDEFNYTGAAEHKLKHEEIRAKLRRLKEKKVKNKIEFNVDLVYFLKEWLDNHLDQMDRKYLKCFREHGVF